MTFDYDALLKAWVPGDPYQPEPGTEAYYRSKHHMIAQHRPAAIVEIGVRAGYSALAMLQAAPGAHYLGLDCDQGGWGGVQGYLDYARERLAPFHAELQQRDSQLVLRVDAPRHAFWHIDGDHSFLGALHDIQLAERSGAGQIAVDDYDYIPSVRAACDWWFARHPSWEAYCVDDGGYRGTCVFTRRAA